MKMLDSFGCEIEIGGVNPQAALEAWDGLCIGFLSHAASTPTHLADLLKHDPENIMAHACKGMFMILLGRRELDATIEEVAHKLDAIIKEGVELPRRESDYVAAFKLARQGQWSRAAIVLEAIQEYATHDAMAFKLVQGFRFMLGDRFGMRSSSLRAVERFGDTHVASGFIYGCHAFALEETGDYRAAETFGRQGVLMRPDDAWGLHAVAHVYDMTAQAELGIEWLEKRTNQWEHCNNFSFHFWWHLALHYLETGDFDKVLQLYDNDIRKQHTDDYRDISNATSLLVRLEGMGVDVGSRWEHLHELCRKHAADNCVVFADLHYMQTLGRLNDSKAMDWLISSLKKNADIQARDMDEVNAIAGIPAAEGIRAYYGSDYNLAFDKLCTARPAMQKIGGSHAQRDVFERMTIDAGLKAGRYQEAKALIEDRTWRRSVEDSFAENRMAQALEGAESQASKQPVYLKQAVSA